MIKEIIYLSFVTASISFTICETKLFESLRDWVNKKNPLSGKLLSCGYCLGHWIALVFVVIFKSRLFQSWWLLDYFLTGLIIAWLAGFQWILMCWLMEKAGK